MRAIQLAQQHEAQKAGGSMMLPILMLCRAGADPLKQDRRNRMNAIEFAQSLGLKGIADRLEAEVRLNDLKTVLGIPVASRSRR